ncbi:23S rRNA pseudouridine2605 synthase [Eilatimonas milleporae]|uniref:Pseudouridine synthase n=2 Tax=Eilatimonas milleporae TaxID=911205 RepID=A0A3M0C2Q2_9PROT|nr:23S rRNA pseudouridine2605 synthase [Eilatimonas milleporae]
MVHRMSDNPPEIDTDTQANGDESNDRIAKVLARAGVGSRREIERMIADGRISLHGRTLESPAIKISGIDGILVDGSPVAAPERTKLWRFHKRRGTLTTARDPEGRRTVFGDLPAHMGRVVTVGRLDMNTEGLLLLTNDGALARWLELPDTGLVRRYRVRVHGRVTDQQLAGLKDGITIDGTHYGAIDAALETAQKQGGANAWLTVAIREGKNREVRRVMEHLGLSVNRLIRVDYGPFSLGSLPAGGTAQVPEKQLRACLPDFFTDAPKTAGTPEKTHTPSRWAKAKKKNTVRPGYKRTRTRTTDGDTGQNRDTGRAARRRTRPRGDKK